MTGALSNNAVLQTTGGKIDVTTAVTGSGGTVSVSGGGTAEFDGAFNQNANFTGFGALLLSAADLGSIGGFGSGDVLDLINIAYAAGDYAVWSQGDGTLQIFASGGGSPLETLNLSGNYTTANFTVTGDGGGGTSGHAEVTFATQPAVLGGATSTTVTQDSLATIGATDTASSSVDTLGDVTITGLPGDLTQGDFNGGTYTPGTNGATGSWSGSAQAFNALAFTVSEAGEFTLDISAATVGAATPATEDYTLIVSSAQSGADNWIATTGDWNTDGDWSLGSPPSSDSSAAISSTGDPSISNETVTLDGVTVTVQLGGLIEIGTDGKLVLIDAAEIDGGDLVFDNATGTLTVDFGSDGTGAVLDGVHVIGQSGDIIQVIDHIDLTLGDNTFIGDVELSIELDKHGRGQ